MKLLNDVHSFVIKVLETDKTAARARQWRYLNSLGPEATVDDLRKANAIAPSDPPVLTADGALRLGAFLRPQTDPELPIHRRLLARLRGASGVRSASTRAIISGEIKDWVK